MSKTLPQFPPLTGDRTTEVLIIGGGMAGLLCAYSLKQAGIDCLLIESDRIGQGVTGRTTAKITSQHGLIYNRILREYGTETARGYWQANEAALGQYRRLGAALGVEIETRDSYVFGRDARGKLDAEWAALKMLSIPAEYVEQTELPFPIAGAIRFRDQAQFHPLEFLDRLVQGLPIYEYTPARAFHGQTVLTDCGRIRAEKIIVATHFPILNRYGGYFLKMYQQRSYVLTLENAPNLDGMYLEMAENGLSLRHAGPYLLLGGGGHRTGKPGGAWSGLESAARSLFPGSKIVARWAAQDCMTLDGIPYIGRYGTHTPGLYVATGFNKWGMTSAMVSAMILTDLVQGRGNGYAGIFTPQRSSLHPQLFRNAMESVVNLLTPTVPRCPHLGCALQWNPQEHTWDCPCHGSRFAENGKLLENPATANLKKTPDP